MWASAASPIKRAYYPVEAGEVGVVDTTKEPTDARRFGVVGSGSNETAELVNARDSRSVIYLPVGTIVIEDFEPSSNKIYVGAGRGLTIVQLPAASVLNLIAGYGTVNTEFLNMTLDANNAGAGTRCMYFSAPQNLRLKNVELKNAAGVSVQLDAANDCFLDDIKIENSTDFGIYLSTSGAGNTVQNVVSRNATTRAVVAFGQTGSKFYSLDHSGTNGEVLYLENCSSCIGDDLIVKDTAGSLSDGVALGGDCYYNTLSNIVAKDCAGHAVSINGQAARGGASYNVVSNVTAVRPDEGGVIITDQGVIGSVPVGNKVNNVVVVNCGQSINTEAFGIAGGQDNEMTNLRAHDSQGLKTMTFGYQESNGVNTASNNHVKGDFSKGLAGIATVTAANSSVVISKMRGMVGADNGDINVTFVAGEDEESQPFKVNLTANRTVTLGAGWNGARFEIIRTGLGAFALDVGGLKTIPASTAARVEVVHDGSAWVLSDYSQL